MEEGRDCGGKGNVMEETRESGGREETVVRETGLIEGSMVVDPRREPDAIGREELNIPSSEFDAEAEDDTELGSETPLNKHKIGFPFVLETPDRKLLAEIPATSNGTFVAFVDQVNAISCCGTLGCTGLLIMTVPVAWSAG